MQNNILEVIDKISGDSLHGKQYYTPEMREELSIKIKEILTSLQITDEMSDFEKISLINNYIKENVKLRTSYFDAMKGIIDEIPNNELYYRTAHAALINSEGICVAFAEATRMLLEASGVKSQTHLAMVPDSRPGHEGQFKKFFHYLIIADCKNKDGQIQKIILDPERESSKDRKAFKNGKTIDEGKKDFCEYMDTIPILITPPQEFLDNQTGKNGLGTPINQIPPENINSKYINDIGFVIVNPKLLQNLDSPKIELNCSDILSIAKEKDVVSQYENSEELINKFLNIIKTKIDRSEKRIDE